MHCDHCGNESDKRICVHCGEKIKRKRADRKKKHIKEEKKPAFRCPCCGEETPELSFCKECGADLKNWSPAVPQRQKQDEQTKCFCPYCGTENKDTSVCEHCGRHMTNLNSARKCPYCSQNTLNHIKCDKCGMQIKGISSEACPHCGKQTINTRLCDKCGKRIYLFKFLYFPMLISCFLLPNLFIGDEFPVITSTGITDILYLLCSLPVFAVIPTLAVAIHTTLVKKFGDKIIFAVLSAIAGVIAAIIIVALLLLIFMALGQILVMLFDVIKDFFIDLYYTIF